MSSKRSLWPAAVASVVLLAIGVMILPGGNDNLTVLPRARELQEWSWGSRTTFPDQLDDTNGWGHYGVVCKSSFKGLGAFLTGSPALPPSVPRTILISDLPSLSSSSEVSLLHSSSWVSSLPSPCASVFAGTSVINHIHSGAVVAHFSATCATPKALTCTCIASPADV